MSDLQSNTFLQSKTQDPTRVQIRNQIRKKRQALSRTIQSQNAQHIASALLDLPQIKTAKHIAVYLGVDGEISLDPLVLKLWNLGINCYLPVVQNIVQNNGRLIFAPYLQSSTMTKNYYGINEPKHSADDIFDINNLDIILMPLVGFDKDNNRLGMGGGFYDKTLEAIIKQSQKSDRPELIGVAHSIQYVDSIPSESWDIKPDSIVTEKNVQN